jgi:hypothetical protein
MEMLLEGEEDLTVLEAIRGELGKRIVTSRCPAKQGDVVVFDRVEHVERLVGLNSESRKLGETHYGP